MLMVFPYNRDCPIVWLRSPHNSGLPANVQPSTNNAISRIRAGQRPLTLRTPKFVIGTGSDPEDACVRPCRSFLASLFEKIFAVINIAVNVTLRSANCRHPFSIEALPISVRPAKQNRRWTQKTCSEDCPNSTRGLIAAAFVIGCERISNAATAAKSRIRTGPRCHLSKRNAHAPSSKPYASFRRTTKQKTAITAAGTAVCGPRLDQADHT